MDESEEDRHLLADYPTLIADPRITTARSKSTIAVNDRCQEIKVWRRPVRKSKITERSASSIVKYRGHWKTAFAALD